MRERVSVNARRRNAAAPGGDERRLSEEEPAEEVAQAGYKGMMAGDTVVIPGAKNKTLAFAVRLAPRNFVTRLVRFMQEKK